MTLNRRAREDEFDDLTLNCLCPSSPKVFTGQPTAPPPPRVDQGQGCQWAGVCEATHEPRISTCCTTSTCSRQKKVVVDKMI